MLPAGVRDCYATRSPVLWRKAFQLWESLRRCSVRLSQAAAGVGVRAVPGAVPCNHLSREDSSELAPKTLALQPWSAALLAHCTGDKAALPVIRLVPRSPRTSLPVFRRRTPAVRPLARLLSQGQITSHQRGSLPRRRTNCRTSRADRPLSPSDQNNPRNACCAPRRLGVEPWTAPHR